MIYDCVGAERGRGKSPRENKVNKLKLSSRLTSTQLQIVVDIYY